MPPLGKAGQQSVRWSISQFVLVFGAAWLIVAAMPGIPPPALPGLDRSWVLGLNMAYVQKLVHGKDIIWTYGPLGYLSYPVAGMAGMYQVLIYRLGVYLIWCVATVRLACVSSGSRYWAASFLVVAVILDPLIYADHLSIAIFACGLLVLVDRSPWRSAGLLALAFLAALACLIKANLGVASFCLLAAVMIGVWFEGQLARPMYWSIVASALAAPVVLLLLYAAVSGSITAFPSYARHSLEIAAGYSEAMAVSGENSQVLIAIISIVILFLILPLAEGSIRTLAPGYAPALVYTFFAFKAAMVRQDAHAADFELQLALAALFLFVVARERRFKWAVGIFQIVCLLYAHQASRKAWPQIDEVMASRLAIDLGTLNAYVHWPQTWESLGQQGRDNLKMLQASTELKSVVGKEKVEAIPWDVAFVRANGWAWHPRPIFQTYAAYVPALDRINAEYLRSNKAAEMTLVSWSAIDGRHPFLEDPSSWRAQLDLYKTLMTDSELLVLGRRSTHRFQAAEPIGTQTTSWNQEIQVPQGADPIEVSAQITRTLRGQLRSVLFRGSPLFIETKRKSGTTERYHALRANFGEGVIMNELPGTLGDLAVLASSGCAISDPVVSFRFQTEGPAEFNSDIRLEWSRLVGVPETPDKCIEITRTRDKIPVWGGVGRVPVSAASGLNWAATTEESWVSIQDGLRIGDGTVRYSILKNPGSTAREGTVTIGGRIYKVVQLGSSALAGNSALVQLGFYGPGPGPQFADLDIVSQHFPPLLPEGQPVVGDWTGNGKMRAGIFLDGTWYLDLNGNRRWDGKEGGDGVFSFGQPGDVPVPGDWVGDGKTRLGIFRNGEWVLDTNGNMALDPSDKSVKFGLAGDIPVLGKWSHERMDRVGIYRNGTWIVDSNGNGVFDPAADERFSLGGAGDRPLVSFGNSRIGIYRIDGNCVLASNDARRFDAQSVRTIPCGLQPLIAAW